MDKFTVRHEKKNPNASLLDGGKFLWGFFSCFLVLVAVSLIFPITEFAALLSRNINSVAVVVSLLVAVLSLFVAYKAMYEQRMAREAGTDPILIAHLGQRADAREMVTFKVSNVGAGAAVNVRLNVTEPAGGLGDRKILVNIFKRHHPFTVIAQNTSIEFSLALGWDLMGNDPLGAFSAEMSYEDVTGHKYDGLFTIDVREMEGLGSEKSPQMRAVKSLEEIAKNIK